MHNRSRLEHTHRHMHTHGLAVNATQLQISQNSLRASSLGTKLEREKERKEKGQERTGEARVILQGSLQMGTNGNNELLLVPCRREEREIFLVSHRSSEK